jgi:hypothetical protein
MAAARRPSSVPCSEPARKYIETRLAEGERVSRTKPERHM